jgi:hypothetical protein
MITDTYGAAADSLSPGTSGGTSTGNAPADAAPQATKAGAGKKPPLGEYQGYIFAGLAVVAIAVAGTSFAPALAAVLAVAIIAELIGGKTDKSTAS